MTPGRGPRRMVTVVFLVVALTFVGMLLRGQWTSLDEVMAATRAFDWSFSPWLLLLATVVGVADLLLMGSVWASLFRGTGGNVRPRAGERHARASAWPSGRAGSEASCSLPVPSAAYTF